MKYEISIEDRQILRELAKKQLEFHHKEENQKRITEWYRHNALQGERPIIHLEAGTFQDEYMPGRLRCQGDFARQVEEKLYENFQNQELFDDDRVTPDYYQVTYDTFFRLFDIKIEVEYTTVGNSESVGHHFVSMVEDLEEDYDKLKPTVFGVDLESTRKKYDAIQEAIGDILPVKMGMNCLYSVPTQMIVHFMSMENMMFNMYDYPELFKEMMDRIAEDTLAYYKFLEEKHLILPTVSYEGVGQGTWAFTKELPGYDQVGKKIFTPKDVWGFMDSQETVGISPEMYEEFIFPCYKKISEQYGILSYGCCEPVHPIWDRCISKLENLRKVSISPWCDEKFMGERLQGSKVIYQRKPSPNYLGVGAQLDEEAFRQHIDTTLEAAKGCKLEITQRDVYTINKDISKARRYVSIIREEIAKYWNS